MAEAERAIAAAPSRRALRGRGHRCARRPTARRASRVRGSRYSVPASYASAARWRCASAAGPSPPSPVARVVARHERSAHRGAELLVLDHYLEVLSRKPGALPGAVALEQARASGSFRRRARTLLEAHPPPSRRPRGDAGADRPCCCCTAEPALRGRARRARCGGARGLGEPGAGRLPSRRAASPTAAARAASWSGRCCGASTARHRPWPATTRCSPGVQTVSAPVTEQAAALHASRRPAGALRLPTVREQAARARRGRAARMRLSQARLPRRGAPGRARRPRRRAAASAASTRRASRGLKHLADFDLEAAPTRSTRRMLATLDRERVDRPGRARRAARRQRRYRQVASADRPRHGRLPARAAGALHDERHSS